MRFTIEAKRATEKRHLKRKWIAFTLCLFLGFLGVHKFYEGKVLLGLLYLGTFGLLTVGVYVDLIVLLFKPDPYDPKK